MKPQINPHVEITEKAAPTLAGVISFNSVGIVYKAGNQKPSPKPNNENPKINSVVECPALNDTITRPINFKICPQIIINRRLPVVFIAIPPRIPPRIPTIEKEIADQSPASVSDIPFASIRRVGKTTTTYE